MIFFPQAVIMQCNPMLLGVPVAIACSFAFMLPVGTPTNTIIQGYAGIQTKDMVSSLYLKTRTIFNTMAQYYKQFV